MRVEVSQLPVWVRIGWTAEERRWGRTVMVDMVVTLDERSRSLGDQDLSHTADYVALAQTVRGALEGQEIPLVETLLDRAGLALLKRFPQVSRVDITATKPCLNDPPDVAGAKLRAWSTYGREDLGRA